MKFAECKLKPTAHATEAMIERGISKTEALDTVLKGVKKVCNKRITSVLRKIKLVYCKLPCQYIVITAYRETER